MVRSRVRARVHVARPWRSLVTEQGRRAPAWARGQAEAAALRVKAERGVVVR
jgi:hypothetical protein